MIDLPKISSHGLVVEAFVDPSAITVRFAGNADTQARDDIQSYLLETHDAVREQSIPKVLVDFRELEFMNSSCFKAFVYWLAEVQSLDEKQQYRIHFLSNEEIHWQRRSLRALSCFAADLVRVEYP